MNENNEYVPNLSEDDYNRIEKERRKLQQKLLVCKRGLIAGIIIAVAIGILDPLLIPYCIIGLVIGSILNFHKSAVVKEKLCEYDSSIRR